MAANTYLVTKASADDPSITLIDGISSCIINSDDGGTDAEIIGEAEAALQGAGVAIPSGYFDTVEDVSPSGILDTDEDLIAFRHRGTVRVIA